VLQADLSHLQVDSPVHPAADIAPVDAQGAFLTQADGANRRVRHAQRDQLLLDGLRPFEAEDFVKAHRPLLIGIPLDQYAPVWCALQELCMALQGGLAVVGQPLAADFERDIVVQDVRASTRQGNRLDSGGRDGRCDRHLLGRVLEDL
jgi:hypothetical protein